MLNGIDQIIIAFGQQALHILPYANTSIVGFPIGEWAWIIVVIECIGQVLIMRFKKVGK
jgi:hypothetical protein